jgi:uncharacterized membrane protein
MCAFACGALVTAAFALTPEPARADFRLCNNTGNRVGIAVGYKENEGWTTEGWWNISARSCETVLRGSLVARFYYIYAVDYDRGGEWSGQAYMCSREKEFTIKGTEDCLARGFKQIQGAIEIGLVRASRVVHTRLHGRDCGQMHNGIHALRGFGNKALVTDIALHELKLRVRRQILAFASRQVIQHPHAVSGREQMLSQM